MTDSIKIISPSIKSLHLQAKPRSYNSTGYGFLPIHQIFSLSTSLVRISSINFDGIRSRITASNDTFSIDSSSSSLNIDSKPVSVELKSIGSEEQFDRIMGEAQQLDQALIIVWMATWCRKCIYLKPKIEKMAADYYPRVGFFCIDVNTVPFKLVNHAGVTKMPTIQLWKDGKKQAEVIGGHKAYLVVNEVREMIENEGPL
ncbi:thioredoxin-like 3-2, chloroplastic [Papaver somniferum]|uniref:thioredoxin-like 3-2, chloroplastic n=1 Tax=Papaver somniferum TaxID=3469 RepID=UPI000E6FA23F|nr:thioredoxin-like 3-2, chloroplastic [Papaver somniferum]